MLIAFHSSVEVESLERGGAGIGYLDPPEITSKPRNLQVKAGGVAAFYCAARGDPLPVIQWKKNGKKVSSK
ncbi:unnamed protein product [Brassicogethes aeneus]|uniref:Ig-like domain-containing protein n=1 Tax=Brassicogethes aeneus TaxID=1431903 RepID=A0A9P0ARJ4_BRAAE|nr:unnamed protein product [Brassicogethes aeneus]